MDIRAFIDRGGILAVSADGMWTIAIEPHSENDPNGLHRMATAICSDKEQPSAAVGIALVLERLCNAEFTLIPKFDQETLQEMADSMAVWHADRGSW